MPSDQTNRDSCLDGLIHRELGTASQLYKLKRGEPDVIMKRHWTVLQSTNYSKELEA
jgi:hypothetical protein